MAITVGTGLKDGKITYYAVVNGKVSKKAYSGPGAMRKALAEAWAIELEELLEELASLEFEKHLVNLREGHGLTVTPYADPAIRYSYTDVGGKESEEGFSSFDNVVWHLEEPKHNLAVC